MTEIKDQANQQLTPQKEKRFWLWFLIALPLVVIIACFYTFYLAVENPLSLVKQDYYKEGLSINQNKRLYQQAEALDLKAELVLLENKTLQIDLLLKKDSIFPSQLNLQFYHPVDSRQDIEVVLERSPKQKNIESLARYVSVVLVDNDWKTLLQENRWYIDLTSGKRDASEDKSTNWAVHTETTQLGSIVVIIDRYDQ